MTKSFWSFGTPGQLLFGRKSIDQLTVLVSRFGWQRVLIVTDRNLMAAGVAAPVQKALAAGNATVEVFDGGEAEPSIAIAEASLSCAIEFNPDVIVGVGGGSTSWFFEDEIAAA